MHFDLCILITFHFLSIFSLSIYPNNHYCLMTVLCFSFRSMLAVIEPGGGGCGGRTFKLQHHGGAAPYLGRDPFKHQASRAPASFYLSIFISLSFSLDSHLHYDTSVFRVCVLCVCVSPLVSSHPRAYAKNLSREHNTPFFRTLSAPKPLFC